MLIKEYRIPLPLTVAEYQIAQLYMIQKKSLRESKGEGSGVEIITNEPYDDGPGGSGQYTFKIYHVGNHLPGGFSSILPAALKAHEVAWNAYPFTKTRYTSPFVDKLSVDVETMYFNDAGTQDNVFNLSSSELSQRVVDFIDIVNDPLAAGATKPEEDPMVFRSSKTHRGPLSRDWLKKINVQNGDPIMCAYKLCRIEFRYWGMQSKIEHFIDTVALRKMLFHAHREAWCWQDEWFGLSMQDIRRLEVEAQANLKKKMAVVSDDNNSSAANTGQTKNNEEVRSSSKDRDSFAHCDDHSSFGTYIHRPHSSNSRRLSNVPNQLPLEAIENESSDDEYFDTQDFEDKDSPIARPTVIRWSSELELGTADENQAATAEENACNVVPGISADQKSQLSSNGGMDLLILVFHGGSFLDCAYQDFQYPSNKRADLTTFCSTMENVCRTHYPSLLGRIAIRLVSCSSVCADAVSVLRCLCPYGSSSKNPSDNVVSWELFSPAMVSLLSSVSSGFKDSISAVISKANSVFNEFLNSEDGSGFNGEVIIVGDAVGGLLAFDALLVHKTQLSRNPSSASAYSDRTDASAAIPEVLESYEPDAEYVNESPTNTSGARDEVVRRSRLSSRRSTSNSCSEALGAICDSGSSSFVFRPAELFLFGCPLGLILAHRILSSSRTSDPLRRPPLAQVHNLFYASDPSCARIEPLLCEHFLRIPPASIPRYYRFPLGDGQSVLMSACLERYSSELRINSENEFNGANRVPSVDRGDALKPVKVCRQISSVSGISEADDYVLSQWWGSKRIDYVLYSPEGLQTFPTSALPSLLHASFWESEDVAAFILRQFVTVWECDDRQASPFFPTEPTERWLNRRTALKIKNLSANHRANDVLVLESREQIFYGKFAYGTFDVVSLGYEKVDVYVMLDSEAGDWNLLGSETTDNSGRLTFRVPREKQLPVGIHPVKMVVRGDHTYLDMFAAVIPPKTECVAFSIDGAFTASVSVSGKDPKVRPGAVDVVRYWQESGYLILYVSARPDMQQRRLFSWLARHNFPHGLMFFTDGISTDPLRQKTQWLKNLVDINVVIHCGYGSSKDIAVYKEVSLPVDATFVIGRTTKKHSVQAVILSEGYAAHLQELQSMSLSVARPAVGNGRLVVSNSCFNRRRLKLVQKTHSFVSKRTTDNNTLQPENASTATSVRSRLKSPFRFSKHKPKTT